jgi:hypothetical protein
LRLDLSATCTDIVQQRIEFNAPLGLDRVGHFHCALPFDFRKLDARRLSQPLLDRS